MSRRRAYATGLVVFVASFTTPPAVLSVVGASVPETVATITAQPVNAAPSASVATVALPFNTVMVDDPNAPSGTTRTVTEGRAGAQILVTFSAGVGPSHELAVVTAPSRDAVVSVGSLTIPATTDAAANRALGQELAAGRGWTGQEWTCLDQLFSRESGWRHNANNASSGAYGIPQALPGSKMAAVASDWATNPATQITWGLNYVNGRYGSPCVAWQHSEDVGWY